jgi:undecaprenyl-diphosphatase
MGFVLDDFFASLFASVTAVGFALLVTGFLLRISDNFHGQKRDREMSFADALIIGIFQGIAITPGISRSGSTIVGALLRGMNRKDAAAFSFLMSIPVILGAGLKELGDVYQETGGFGLEPSYFAGALVAAFSGYLAIKIFLRLVEKSKLRYFSYYCWAL